MCEQHQQHFCLRSLAGHWVFRQLDGTNAQGRALSLCAVYDGTAHLEWVYSIVFSACHLMSFEILITLRWAAEAFGVFGP